MVFDILTASELSSKIISLLRALEQGDQEPSYDLYKHFEKFLNFSPKKWTTNLSKVDYI